MKTFLMDGIVWILWLVMGAVVTVAALVAGTVAGLYHLARCIIPSRKGGGAL